MSAETPHRSVSRTVKLSCSTSAQHVKERFTRRTLDVLDVHDDAVERHVETVIVLRRKPRNQDRALRVILNGFEPRVGGVAPDEQSRDVELLPFDPGDIRLGCTIPSSHHHGGTGGLARRSLPGRRFGMPSSDNRLGKSLPLNRPER